MTAMLSGIKKAHVSSPELSILFRFIDPDNNYAFYRKESSKDQVLPFLLPDLNTKASGEDNCVGRDVPVCDIPYMETTSARTGQKRKRTNDLGTSRRVLGHFVLRLHLVTLFAFTRCA